MFNLLPILNMWREYWHLRYSSSNVVVTDFFVVITTVIPENAFYDQK